MKITVCALALLLFFSSCDRDDDTTAPPITTENTFSCKINGELFIPQDFSNFPNSFDGYKVNFREQNNNFFSLFRNSNENLYVHIYNLTTDGTYPLSEADGDSFFVFDENTVIEYSSIGNLVTTHISTSISGTIEVLELDFGNKIIFQFDEIILEGIDNPEDTIILTEGRANFNLETFEN